MGDAYEVYADGALVMSTKSAEKAEREYDRRYRGGAEAMLVYPSWNPRGDEGTSFHVPFALRRSARDAEPADPASRRKHGLVA